MGKKTMSENGHVCGSWTLQRAYPGEQFPGGDLSLAENYCRNPKPTDSRVWCYYTYQDSTRRKWDFCSLQHCRKYMCTL